MYFKAECGDFYLGELRPASDLQLDLGSEQSKISEKR
jgi:hypothetical protein